MCCICAHNFKKHSDKSIAQATVFQSLTVAVSSKVWFCCHCWKDIEQMNAWNINVSINYKEMLNTHLS